jgi:hypothetical protein
VVSQTKLNFLCIVLNIFRTTSSSSGVHKWTHWTLVVRNILRFIRKQFISVCEITLWYSPSLFQYRFYLATSPLSLQFMGYMYIPGSWTRVFVHHSLTEFPRYLKFKLEIKNMFPSLMNLKERKQVTRTYVESGLIT